MKIDPEIIHVKWNKQEYYLKLAFDENRGYLIQEADILLARGFYRTLVRENPIKRRRKNY